MNLKLWVKEKKLPLSYIFFNNGRDYHVHSATLNTSKGPLLGDKVLRPMFIVSSVLDHHQPLSTTRLDQAAGRKGKHESQIVEC